MHICAYIYIYYMFNWLTSLYWSICALIYLFTYLFVCVCVLIALFIDYIRSHICGEATRFVGSTVHAAVYWNSKTQIGLFLIQEDYKTETNTSAILKPICVCVYQSEISLQVLGICYQHADDQSGVSINIKEEDILNTLMFKQPLNTHEITIKWPLTIMINH